MKPLSGVAGVCLLGWLTVGAGTASAAWDNVFQVCCHKWRAPRAISFFAPAAPAVVAPAVACPTISYRVRCFYQPVTTYRMQTRLEPVTSYRMSYYYEPVTSQRCTSFFDPCTGCCKQVCCPVTSFRLRSRCNAVVSYVQRCEMVPVTTFRQAFRLEPVVECPPCPDPCAPAAVVAPAPAPAAVAPAPGISEAPGSIPPAIEETPGNSGGQLPPQQLPLNNGTNRGSARPFSTPEPPAAAPPVRMDRIAGSGGSPSLQGQVVAGDRSTPRSGARLIFVRAEAQAERRAVTADGGGRFRVALSSGDWLVYLADGSGKAVYHSRIRLRPDDHRLVTVVSR